ncbi:MAG: undecaprenyl-diphosphatase, partial [Candidatus Poribacteria bacterium]|nr:undecaprenyl-diphosphatase [Candidatus Poribacteria bacterium]
MTILEAILLGVLQGLTEFLPVSSSGHLVLAQHFLGLKEPQILFDVMLHLGTLGAVVIVYYRSIWSLGRTSLSSAVNVNF